MGRKIPAKKHRGVKDPIEQQARRFQSIKCKINAPPADPDEQPVPRSLQVLFAPRRPPSTANTRSRTRPHTHSNKGRAGGGGVSRLRRLPGEEARSFSLRINSAVRALHAPPAAGRYPPDHEEEKDARGARMAALRERRARKQRRAGHDKPAAAAPALSRSRKLALKKKARKDLLEQAEACERREVRYERVHFGEVAHEPPALRAAAADRPGRRGLLLSAMLAPAEGAGGAADVRRRERVRLDAVAAYRALKAARQTHKSAKKNHHT